MKLKRTEWAAAAVTILFFAVLAGYHLLLRTAVPVVSLIPAETISERVESGEEPAADAKPDAEGRIDLNTADAALLDTLPGIGEVLAERIIAYREAYGGFRSIEEIMNVKGIGEGKFADIKDLICVSGG